MAKKKETLRPDTTLAPVGKPEAEVYLWRLPVCCLRSFKEAIVEGGERRSLELGCGCGRAWLVTSSLDERVLGRFVTHAGPRVDGGKLERLQASGIRKGGSTRDAVPNTRRRRLGEGPGSLNGKQLRDRNRASRERPET